MPIRRGNDFASWPASRTAARQQKTPSQTSFLIFSDNSRKNDVRKIGSSARTRTWNLVVTSAPKFLLGLDYLFTLSRILEVGCRALPMNPIQGTSFRSSLCTFPDLFYPAGARLRVTIFLVRKAGFPEFTRFFSHDYSWKLL